MKKTAPAFPEVEREFTKMERLLFAFKYTTCLDAALATQPPKEELT